MQLCISTIAWYFGLVATSRKSTQLQQNPVFRYLSPWSSQVRGEKLFSEKNVSGVDIGSSGSVWYLLLGVIWDHLLLRSCILLSIAYLLWDMLRNDSAACWNPLCSFITIHQSSSWSGFLRARHSPMLPQLDFCFFSPKRSLAGGGRGKEEGWFKVMPVSKEKKQFHSYNNKNH